MKYKKALDIFESVSEELNLYADEGMIDTSKLIKVIKECNATLGLHINENREAILEVNNHKVRLPDDFEVLNFAVMCATKKLNVTPVKGFQIEQVDIGTHKRKSCDVTSCGDECGDFTIFQKCEQEFKEYTCTDLVKLVNTESRLINSGCFNLTSNSYNEVSIKNGWLHTNFEKGTIYLNYVGEMIDADGDLLVIDHDMINPYYEAACIYRFFRNLYSNHDGDELQRMQFWKEELKEARKQALLVRNMPEYTELTAIMKHLRLKYYNKYERYFRTRNN